MLVHHTISVLSCVYTHLVGAGRTRRDYGVYTCAFLCAYRRHIAPYLGAYNTPASAVNRLSLRQSLNRIELLHFFCSCCL